LVSGESKAHTLRWRDALSTVFEDVRMVQGDLIEALSSEDYVFSTPIDTVTLDLVERFPAAKHIAISNALDMMDSKRFSNLVSSSSLLERTFDIWVDTDWAVNAIHNLGVSRVAKLPWGLVFATPHLHTPREGKGGSGLLIPRLGNDNFQPQVIFEAIKNMGNLAQWSNVVTIGMPRNLAELLVSNVDIDFTHLPLVEERKLLELMDDAHEILFAPKTDGVSVTMLQALHQGKSVLSTPTIGAIEWSRIAPNVHVSKGFDVDDLQNLLIGYKREDSVETREASVAAVEVNANLVNNIRGRMTQLLGGSI
jgi:hypothetical protein